MFIVHEDFIDIHIVVSDYPVRTRRLGGST